MKLENKIALVTGGTRGIGFAVVKEFLKEGATVVMCGSRQHTVDSALAQLKEINPNYPVEGICPNITNYEEVHNAVNAVIEKYGHIDILVNNAGIADAHFFNDYTEESFRHVVDINFMSVFNFCHAVLPHMQANNYGSVINTSSISGRDGAQAGMAYPVTKSAVNAMTKCLAREFAPYQIRVNAIGPGMTATDMNKDTPAEYIEFMKQSIPMGRFAEVEEMVDAYVYLASDGSRYMSGQVLYIDGLARI